LDNITFSTAPVPEPGALSLFMIGATLTAAVLRCRRQ
jgi:hypothetical protein